MTQIQTTLLASMLTLFGFFSAVHATPVTWNLQGVMTNGPMGPTDTYGDGPVTYPVTGSFVYDADTNTYSSINIVTPFRTWTDANLAVPWLQDNRHLKVLDATTDESMVLSFLSDLTNAGGTVTLRTGDDAVDCFISECGSVEYGETGPLTWTLQNVTTTGGVPWTGSFDWQGCSPSSCYLNINIVSGVTGFPNPVDSISTDSVLGNGCTDPATDSGVTLGPDADGFTIFCMDFVSPLTIHGGTIDLVTGGTGWAVQGFSEVITGGSVSSPPLGGPYYFAGAVSTSSPAQTVTIDVDGWVNHANHYHPHHNKELHPNHDGTGNAQSDPVEVVIYGAADFDASQVDGTTLRFGPAEAGKTATALGIQEVTGDSYIDATAEFMMSDMGMDPNCADTELSLTGETLTGTPFQGTDADIECRADAGCHP